jgi:hypothetical protein
MTTEDQKKLRDELAIELEAAERNLAHECAAVRQLAASMEVLAHWLRESADGNPPTLKPTNRPDLDTTIREVAKYKEVLNYEFLIKAVDAVKKARELATEVRKSLHGLTRSFYT